MNSINGSDGTKLGSHPQQLQLWDSPPLNPVHRLKTAMRDALKACPLSRTQVISAMNELADRDGLPCCGRTKKIMEDTLDKWVAAGAVEHLIPLKLLPIFCFVTGSSLPLLALAATIGAEVIGPEDRKLLEWARAESRRRHLTKEARRLAQEVGLK